MLEGQQLKRHNVWLTAHHHPGHLKGTAVVLPVHNVLLWPCSIVC